MIGHATSIGTATIAAARIHTPNAESDRVEQRPAFSLDKVKETTPRELVIRFLSGAASSVPSGAVTLGFGPRWAGSCLASRRSWRPA